MALVLNDRVQETCSAPGTGAVTLLGAVTGFQTFSSGVGNGNTCYYCIADQGGANWEVGLGTYASGGNTLTRTTPYAGSASTPVNFSSGVQTVFVTYPSEKSVNLDATGNVSALGTVSSGTWQGSTIGVAYGGTGVTTSTGTGNVVLSDSPVLTTPNLGTPSAVNLTNGTALPLTTGVSGVLPTANGGTNLSSFTSGGVVYASSTSALTTGSALTFDGTNLGIGTSNTPSNKDTVTPKLVVNGAGVAGSMQVVRNTTPGAGGAIIELSATRGSDVNSYTILQSGDGLGTLAFGGADGNEFVRGGSISCQVDGTPGDNDMPGRLIFGTTADGASADTERMRIDSSGNVGVGTSSPSSYGRLAVMTPTANYGFFGIANSAGGAGGVNMAQYYGTTKISYIDSTLTNGTPGAETAFLAFATANSGTLAERMRISSSGNVLIGNTNGTSPLTVTGVVESTTGGFKFPDGTTQTTAATAGLTQAKATGLNFIFGL